MLEVRDLEVSYGPVRAVRGVSLDVRPGEIVSILGANGAGKSSTLLGLLGIVKARGEVRWKGRGFGRGGAPATRRGLVLCPENRHVFPELTVAENLSLGAFARGDARRSLPFVLSLFPLLAERSRQAAGSLSGGEQQMLAVGRALMAEPELLILDEPSLGLAPKIVDELFRVLASLRERMPVLLVEQNARKALGISDRAYVLRNGSLAHEGSAAAIMADDALRNAYLGGEVGA